MTDASSCRLVSFAAGCPLRFSDGLDFVSLVPFCLCFSLSHPLSVFPGSFSRSCWLLRRVCVAACWRLRGRPPPPSTVQAGRAAKMACVRA